MSLYSVNFVSYMTYYWVIDTDNDIDEYVGSADVTAFEEWVSEVIILPRITCGLAGLEHVVTAPATRSPAKKHFSHPLPFILFSTNSLVSETSTTYLLEIGADVGRGRSCQIAMHRSPGVPKCLLRILSLLHLVPCESVFVVGLHLACRAGCLSPRSLGCRMRLLSYASRVLSPCLHLFLCTNSSSSLFPSVFFPSLPLRLPLRIARVIVSDALLYVFLCLSPSFSVHLSASLRFASRTRPLVPMPLLFFSVA